MTVKLTAEYKKVTENEVYDFYIYHVHTTWYVYAVRKNDNELGSMAGFTTKKVAVHCAHTWAEWMHGIN